MSPALRPLLAGLLLLTASCSTLVAPRTILAEQDLDLAQKEDYLAQWEAGIAKANAFLASEANLSLPHGSYELLNDGMILRTEDRAWEVSVKKTTYGRMAASFGYPAQERSWGFVVGSGGKGPSAVANTLFYRIDGQRRSADAMAELILHESAHQIFDVGTLGFWKGARYYWLSMFYGYDGHPDEADPYRVSQEYRQFVHPGTQTIRLP